MLKRTLRRMALGLGLSTMMVGGFAMGADEPAPKPDAPAQQPATPAPQPTPPAQNGARPGRRTPADVVANYRDQFEGLNLTDDQMKKIDGFIETAEAEIKANGSSEDRANRRKSWEALRKLNEDVQSVLNDQQKAALQAKQRQQMFDRFKQSYLDPKLNLSEEQTKKINDIFAQAKTDFAGVEGQDDASRQKRREIFQQTREKLNAVLTPDQQKQIPQFGPRRGGNGGGAQNPPPPPAAN